MPHNPNITAFSTRKPQPIKLLKSHPSDVIFSLAVSVIIIECRAHARNLVLDHICKPRKLAINSLCYLYVSIMVINYP